nr:TaqI-like C-terminal specificity domain-containing protein [Halorubrum sp. 48-1-W]
MDEHLPETEAWNEIDEEELQAAYDDIKQLWDEQKSTVERRNESQLEEKFVRPMFRKLGIPFEVEESTSGTQRRPDYGFFETESDATDAFKRREEGGDFYKNAVAVADAKRWGRKLDSRGEKKRDYENPSHQIDQYLRFTSTTWGVLTNGQKWRLYYKPTSHKLDSYYEIDLPTVLETGNLEEFKYFYLFFRHEAFVPDASGDAFLDDVYEESNIFAQELGQDLQDNIYEAIKLLSEGYLQYPENDLDEDDLSLIHDSSLIYLYRIIFVLYAEAEGRDLLDTNNQIYESRYSLNQLKQEVAEELESGDPKYRDWQDDLQSQLDELFMLIDEGSKSQGIPEDDLYIPAYNGGLFRTNPSESGSEEARFLANNTVGDEHLARVIELLTRSESSNGAGKIFVDYSSLDVRHLGSIYEGLLEYQLNVADEPLALDDGEYVLAGEGNELAVERGDVYLTTGSGERKATGSYYTPEYVVEYIVEETLSGPVDQIRKDVVMDEEYQGGGYADEFAERIFDLKILDPAMGSGHFLTSVVDYLARAIITEQNREADEKGGDAIKDEHDINWARRKVAQRCIYGVDINPLATELAKVSLWLRTLATEQPLAFLDHHLKTGNSLVGSDIHDVLIDDDESKTDKGQLTLEQSFAHTRKQALDHVMDRFSELLAIDNETLEDAKEMEDVYQSVQGDPLYQKLLSMANVHTVSQFGLDVPSDADKRMAEALRANSWENVERQDWFKSAQKMANDELFFHWELEFPVAFYDIDGNRKENAGFDAVIGNPPYVRQEQLSASKAYLSQRYNCYDSAADLYSYFIERGQSILCEGGMFGYIVSNKFIHADYGEGIRRSLANKTSIRQIVDFHSLPVFSRGISAYPAILLFQNSQPKSDSMVEICVMENLNFDQLESVIQEQIYEIPQQSLDSQSWSLQRKEIREILSKINDCSEPLESYLDQPLYRGILTGLNDAFILSEEEKDKIDYDGKHLKQLLQGKDVHRYEVEYNGRYLIRIPSGWTKNESGIADEADAWSWFKSEFPILADYLSEFKQQAKQRYDRGEFWWELRPCDYYAIFEEEKIVYPVISKGPNFAYDAEERYINDKLYAIPGKEFDLLGILNSKLIHFWLQSELSGLRGGYQEFRATHVEKLPVVTDIETADRVSQKVSDEIDFRQQRNNLNLKLLDYLGNYTEGPELPSMGIFQPTSASILDSTTEEYEKLQIERTRIEREESQVMIYATARYKPEDEDKFETDTYGYTETEYKEAFTLTDLSDKEATLIEAFVPVAVKKADGFANFRDNATKTNSLIDRLKAMTLPDIDDVTDDLERYIEVKERAEELDEKIEKTDRLIDEIVYDLYDLTDEEIDIVESAVADD